MSYNLLERDHPQVPRYRVLALVPRGLISIDDEEDTRAGTLERSMAVFRTGVRGDRLVPRDSRVSKSMQHTSQC
ncbi:hypothetical protein AVEN_244961-1 [Araneus ventricosus]|uniref:Uncharacterized protein n=1 Tax=Araneus ventricosus TaxID=182803 RepID=A0A4Y2X7K8_ARAVE|nr:hypothetical protein AVEN_244961-1 [Araneus ventricosus]